MANYQSDFPGDSAKIEPLNQKSLDEINKHQTVLDIRNCAEALSRYKIRLIASIVLGIDADSKEDIERAVDFAKQINAYQLQPEILTPFPGTPVYEQYESEHRMLTKEWELFDMMNVTFMPKKMTPWELQKQAIAAVLRFYSIPASFKIWRTFGADSGVRRLGLWLITRLGVLGVYFVANFAKGTYLYKIKHMNNG